MQNDITYREFAIGMPAPAPNGSFQVSLVGRSEKAKALLESATGGSATRTVEGADRDGAIRAAQQFIDGLLAENAI